MRRRKRMKNEGVGWGCEVGEWEGGGEETHDLSICCYLPQRPIRFVCLFF